MIPRLPLLVVLLALLAPSSQVAVLPLLPQAPDPEHDWVGTALADLIATELARREGIVVVERERVADLLRELDLRESGIVAAPEAGRFARVAAADRAVFGTFRVSGREVSAEVGMVDAATGETVGSARRSGSLSDLREVAAALASGLFGPAPSGPAGRAARLPVEPLAEYYRGIAAEARGDYPEAFVRLSRAARAAPPHPDAAGELARLFLRMGEPEHAVAEWRRLGELVLVARTMEEEMGDPAAAARVWEEIAAGSGDVPEALRAERERARLKAAAGDEAGAAEILAAALGRAKAGWERLRAEYLATQARREVSHPENAISDREQLVGQEREAIEIRRRRLWLSAFLAGRLLPHRPDDVLVLGPEPEQPLDGARLPGRLWLVAPPGRGIASVTVRLRLAPPADGRTFECGVGLQPDGSWSDRFWRRFPPADEPREEIAEFALPVPARFAGLSVGGFPVPGWSAVVRLGPAPPETSREAAGGIDGVAQQARLSRAPDGAVHVVVSAGSPRFHVGRAAGVSVQGDDGRAALLLATSTDGGETFGPARRLRVASGRHDLCPFLLSGRDGRHHLVWVANRASPDRYAVWYSRSEDLATWSFPREVPVPFVPFADAGPGMTGETGWAPELVEGPDRKLHLFVLASSGPEGEGIYRMETADGLCWSPAVLVAPGERAFSAVLLPDGSFLVASRMRGEGTVLARSRDGVRFEEAPAPSPGTVRHAGRLDRPLLAAAADGAVLLAERYDGDDLGLTVIPAEGEPRSRVVPLEAGDLGGILPRDGGTALAVFTPWAFDLPGSVRAATVEVPR